ncbi:MAG: toxic anion resistance protein [Pseudomonadota bacterium]
MAELSTETQGALERALKSTAATGLDVLNEQPISLSNANDEQRAAIDALRREIDMADSNSVLFFGSKAQEQLTTVSDSMLEGVRNKDLGAAGDSLNDMVAVLRGFDVDGLKPDASPGLIGRFINWILGRGKPMAKFIQQYETVRPQIETITDTLESHKTMLLTDIASLDRLYDANLDYFHTLELYIAAGEAEIAECDEVTLPALKAEVEASADDVLKAQELRDLHARRDDLERRVHDLKLTRQVAMQALPSIRMVQENDKGLITKINSTLVNTVPLWRNQLAQAVAIFRSQKVTRDVKAATDLTNDLLEKNAENLRTGNREVREQMERGVFDMASVKKAHADLLASIEESLQIADEGKRRRAEAEVELGRLESELRDALTKASSTPATAEPVA